MIELQPGLLYYPDYLPRAAQESLAEEIRAILRAAPLFTPVMPKTGKAFSTRMSNCGSLGWVSDRDGYRYQDRHPVTGALWPPMPARLPEIWSALAGCAAAPPDVCLINYYSPDARMGLHQDSDEKDRAAPVLSLSLGASCLFRYGGAQRRDKTQSIKLHSGDVLTIGGASRLCFHGVDRILAGSFAPLAQMGRLNLTLRRAAAS